MQAYVWVVVGVFLYAAITAAAALRVFNMKRTSDLDFQFDEYFPSHRLGYLVTVERGIWAMASFIIWFRLLKCAPHLALSPSLSPLPALLDSFNYKLLSTTQHFVVASSVSHLPTVRGVML